MPEGTVNAIGLLVTYLLDNNIWQKLSATFLTFPQQLCSTTDGTGTGIQSSDDVWSSDPSLGTTRYQGWRLRTDYWLSPSSTTGEAISARMAEFARLMAAPLRFFPMQKFLSTLTQILEITTLLGYVPWVHRKLFVIGGGTYASL